MEQLNKIELRGNVGHVRLQTVSGRKVANISLATSVAYKDASGGAVIETTWLNVVAWQGRVEADLDSIQVGTKLYVSGRLRLQHYLGGDGMEKSSYDVLANQMEIIESKEALGYGAY